MTLNRRHKAVLFITLVITGLALVGGAGMRVSLGIALLGFALALAVGSNSRVIHELIGTENVGKLRRFALILLATVAVGGIGLLGWNIIQENIQEKHNRDAGQHAVRDGLLVIDQEVHHWNLGSAQGPLKIVLFIRNKSDHEIRGNLLFSATLAEKGLEQEYLDKMIERYGDERLKRDLEEEFHKGKKTAKFQAIHNYIARGKRLPPGERFEPLPADGLNVHEFSFKFREWVSIGPGEISEVRHTQNLPPSKRGYLLKVAMEDIE